MSPRVLEAQLAPDDLATAHALWDALMFPATHSSLEEARRQLIEAPAHIQQLLINEIAGAIRQHHEPLPDENPFA